jgi:hypothetical protein
VLKGPEMRKSYLYSRQLEYCLSSIFLVLSHMFGFWSKNYWVFLKSIFFGSEKFQVSAHV